MRVATWYVNGRKMNMHRDLIQQVNPHILAVQGLTLAGYEKITGMGSFDDWRFSMNLIEKKYTSRDRGVGIFVKYPYAIKSVYLIPDIPFKERAMVVEIAEGRDNAFLLGIMDVPDGETYKELKGVSLLAYTQWMKEKKGIPKLGCLKYTGPKVDHPDLSQIEFWGDIDSEGGRELLQNNNHLFKDAYRDFLDQRLEIKKEIIKKRPQGPLGITYKTPNPYRYDYIFKSPHFHVNFMDHLWEESKNLSSHALVYADLTIL